MSKPPGRNLMSVSSKRILAKGAEIRQKGQMNPTALLDVAVNLGSGYNDKYEKTNMGTFAIWGVRHRLGRVHDDLHVRTDSRSAREPPGPPDR